MERKVKDPDKRVGLLKLTLWQTSSVSVALSTLVLMYVNIYCTDTLHLDILIVSTIFMVTKIVDAVTDMVVGVIIDRTNTRWGKGRPYEIFMLFLWLATWLLFSTPASFSDTAKYIWLATMYIFMNAICKTFLNGNNVVYLVRAFKTKQQQVKVTAFGSFFTMGASMAFNILFPTAMANMATSPAGWSRLIGMLAVPLTVVGLLRMLTIKEQYNNEQDVKPKGEKMQIKDVVTVLTKNRYLLIVLFVGLTFALIGNMGVAVYYWTWIVGDVKLMGVTSAFTILGLPLAFVLPWLQRKFGLGKTVMGGFAVVTIAYLCIYFVGSNMIPLIVCTFFTSIGVVPFSMLKNIFIVDLASYNEYNGMQRMEGTMNALLGLMDKTGGAVGGFVLGVLLRIAGYNGALTAQPESAMMMIRLAMSVIPAIAYLAAILALRSYKLDKDLPEMKEKFEAASKQ